MPETTRRENSTRSLDGITVLVVDDHLDTLELLRRWLQFNGARVLVAEDGAAAWAVLAESTPDVVLIDLLMPVMDGLKLAHRIRQDSQRARMKLVAVTALGTSPDLLKTFEVGFDAHLVKPIELDTLLQTITRVLFGL